jgi:hypothetical protein
VASPFCRKGPCAANRAWICPSRSRPGRPGEWRPLQGNQRLRGRAWERDSERSGWERRSTRSVPRTEGARQDSPGQRPGLPCLAPSVRWSAAESCDRLRRRALSRSDLRVGVGSGAIYLRRCSAGGAAWSVCGVVILHVGFIRGWVRPKQGGGGDDFLRPDMIFQWPAPSSGGEGDGWAAGPRASTQGVGGHWWAKSLEMGRLRPPMTPDPRAIRLRPNSDSWRRPTARPCRDTCRRWRLTR